MCLNICQYTLYIHRDLSCSDTKSFDIKIYNGTNCGGILWNEGSTKIYTGCQQGNNTFNSSFINKLFPNIPIIVSSNQTYFDISECGGAWPLWATILITVGAVLCCCGICAALAWVFCRRRKGGMTQGLVQNTQGYS